MVLWYTPKASCNKYSFDIEPSSFIFCLTKSFDVFMYLLMKNIHLYGIGLANLTSSTKWIIKCCWPSKNDVENCICKNVIPHEIHLLWRQSHWYLCSLLKSIVPTLTIYKWPLILMELWDLELLLECESATCYRSRVTSTLKPCHFQ